MEEGNLFYSSHSQVLFQKTSLKKLKTKEYRHEVRESFLYRDNRPLPVEQFKIQYVMPPTACNDVILLSGHNISTSSEQRTTNKPSEI
jgi:hypothetical protein